MLMVSGAVNTIVFTQVSHVLNMLSAHLIITIPCVCFLPDKNKMKKNL